MREILFRGKTMCEDDYDRSLCKDDVWVYGDLDIEPEYRIAFIKCDDEDDKSLRHILKVRFDTVGQYTGITDKNGTKIFEGDILKRIYPYRTDILLVYWNDERLQWMMVNGNYYHSIIARDTNADNFDIDSYEARIEIELSEVGALMASTGGNHFEIIGNIWDNPELIEDTKSTQNTMVWKEI